MQKNKLSSKTSGRSVTPWQRTGGVPPRCTSVIFDLDGTLLDTLADLAGAMNRVLAARGYETASVEAYRMRVGWGLREMVIKSLPPDDAADPSIVEAVAAEFRQIHFAHPVIETVAYPGIPELISALTQSEFPLFVNTNKPDPIAATVVNTLLSREALGTVTEPFTAILGQRDDIPQKPDPAGVHLLLGDNELEPAECWYIGDSDVDMETARAAGCTAVGVSWGFRDAAALAAAGADQICYSVQDVREALAAAIPLPELAPSPSNKAAATETTK
ncbi:MAG: HAD family hydrolase [Spirochaeta sp.]|nr:HAD family hydrolase [Spirochaeta sp.]